MYKQKRRRNIFGKPRNDNYMVNVCDDVVLSKHTQGPSEENKQNVKKMVQKHEKGKPEDSHYTPHQDMKQSISLVIMNSEKTW
jgi:hypothetical protein